MTVHLHTSDFMTGCYVLLQSFYNEWHYIDGLDTRDSGFLEASLRNGLNTKIEIELLYSGHFQKCNFHICLEMIFLDHFDTFEQTIDF